MRLLTLRVLAAYLVVSVVAHGWGMSHGRGNVPTLIGEAVLLGLAAGAMRSRHWAWRRLGDWLPLLSLPLLYAGVQWSMFGGGVTHDPAVQAWDRALFGTDAARTLAGAMPWRPLSELLHLAYFSYYGIIYAPALYLYLRRPDERAFRDLVLAFTMAMIACFLAFIVFPVAGPRYEWAAPPEVPGGPVRSVVLSVLEAGSTRGTAFPSSHAAISLAIALSVFRWERLAGGVLIAMTVLLGIGAVYGGFHYATDIVAGMALGVGCWGISRLLGRRSFEAGSENRDRVLP